MDEDKVLGLMVLVTWVVGILAGISVIGFVCWGIYRLVVYFL